MSKSTKFEWRGEEYTITVKPPAAHMFADVNLLPGLKYKVEATDRQNALIYEGEVLDKYKQTKIGDSGLTIEEILTSEAQTYIRNRFAEFPAR